MIKRTLFALVALAFLVPAAQAGEKLTWRDCSKVFTWANAVEKSQTLDGRLCGEAWHLSYARDGEDEFLGYVFRGSASAEGQRVNLLVGVKKTGEIAKVVVTDSGIVDAEFLAQFAGRTAKSDFSLAQSGDDLTTTPSMLKAMRDKEALSLAIANEVRAILTSATGVSGMLPTP